MLLLVATVCTVLQVDPGAVGPADADGGLAVGAVELPADGGTPQADYPPPEYAPAPLGSGVTLVNPSLDEPDAGAPEVAARKARLLAIDDQLDKLSNPRTPGAAFGEAFNKLLPFWLVSIAPILVLGYLEVDPHASPGNEQAVGIALGLAGATVVVMLSYCVMVAIGAWMDEVPNDFDRDKKINDLVTERKQLVEQLHSP